MTNKRLKAMGVMLKPKAKLRPETEVDKRLVTASVTTAVGLSILVITAQSPGRNAPILITWVVVKLLNGSDSQGIESKK